MPKKYRTPAPALSAIRKATAELALSGSVSLEALAGHLDTSPRTLQRHLRQHGIGFRSIVEESRFSIADALICGTDLDLKDISRQLNYSSPNAFSRAYARWAGCTPTSARKAAKQKNRAKAPDA